MTPKLLAELSFSASRASGPGGQNVNKVNSKIELRWSVLSSTAVSPAVRQRFALLYRNRLTKEGELVISSGAERDQSRNRAACIERFEEMLAKAATPPKRRKKTGVPRAVKQKRRDDKSKNAQKKQSRRARPGDF